MATVPPGSPGPVWSGASTPRLTARPPAWPSRAPSSSLRAHVLPPRDPLPPTLREAGTLCTVRAPTTAVTSLSCVATVESKATSQLGRPHRQAEAVSAPRWQAHGADP